MQKKKIMKRIILVVLIFTGGWANAQQFISQGQVEFEVRTNTHKIFGDGIWADMARERFPQFATNYYTFTFQDNRAVYRFDRNDDVQKVPFGREKEDDIWFNDYAAGTYTDMKWVFDNTYLLTDSLLKIDWKLVPYETRDIAGFNCRKAQGIIFDSVYVFAFYTDEITIPGGPMGLNGLPGMILGVTIPRMYTSWVATKVTLNYDPKKVVPPTKGKKKDATELLETVMKATKDWGNWGQQAVWGIFL